MPRRACPPSCRSGGRSGVGPDLDGWVERSEARRAMPLCSFEQLRERADREGWRVPIAAAGGADRTVLEALRTALDRGWVPPTVVGREEEIRRAADEAAVPLEGFRIIDADEPAAAAVAEVRSGRARLLMKGRIATPALMRAVLDPATGLRSGRVIAQVVL